MLKENWRLISRVEQAGDALIILLSFFIAYYGRDSLIYWNEAFDWGLSFRGLALAPISDYFIVPLVSLVGYFSVLSLMGAYDSMRLSSSLRILRLSLVSSVLVFFLLAGVLFLLKLDLSRSFIGLFCLLVTVAITAERYVVLEVLRFWRKRGRNFRNVIIGGVGDQAVELARQISRKPALGLRILGFADLRESPAVKLDEHMDFRARMRAAGCQRIGRMLVGKEAFDKALTEYAVDEVIFTDVVHVMPLVCELAQLCAEQGIRTTIAADLFSVGLVKSGISYFGGMPLIHFQTPPGDQWELLLKRAVDVFVSAAALVVFSPVFLVIAIAIKRGSPGPVLFRQRRVGLHGRQFTFYKFRSMVLHAETELVNLQANNEMSGPVFKMTNDPRVTPLGSILRRFSLDELPQFWNVLIGDMSLVGPRPPIPGEVSMYERSDRRRLSMRPGMTCIWQVSGRNEIKNFDDWVKLDLKYIDNWSLKLDFILLLKTIPAVLLGSGAR